MKITLLLIFIKNKKKEATMIFNIPSPVLCLVTQSYSTLCDPMDCSPPGSSVHGDSPVSNPGSGLPCPLPGALHNPGIKLMSSALQVDSLPSEPPGKPIPSPARIIFLLFICCSVWLFATPWSAAHPASLSFTISWSYLLTFIYYITLKV